MALEGAFLNLSGHFGITPTAYSPLLDVLVTHFFNLKYLHSNIVHFSSSQKLQYEFCSGNIAPLQSAMTTSTNKLEITMNKKKRRKESTLRSVTMHNLDHLNPHIIQDQIHFDWEDMNLQQAFSRWPCWHLQQSTHNIMLLRHPGDLPILYLDLPTVQGDQILQDIPLGEVTYLLQRNMLHLQNQIMS